MKDIDVLVFDAYGTLFDVHSVTQLAESVFPGRGAALSQAWRTKQLEYTWLRSLMHRYEDFNCVTRAALDWACDLLGADARDEDKARLMDAYRKLSTFPEVPAALAELASARPLAILSNGHPEMLQAVVDHNGLAALFGARVLSVHEAGIFKPAPQVYRIASARLGAAPERIGFVSSNGWDIAGAKAFGFRTIWVNRGKLPRERLGSPPDAQVAGLGEIAALLA